MLARLMGLCCGKLIKIFTQKSMRLVQSGSVNAGRPFLKGCFAFLESVSLDLPLEKAKQNTPPKKQKQKKQ